MPILSPNAAASIALPAQCGYQHTTFAQAKAQLAERLSDPGNSYWVDAELGLYLIESLRVWNSLTSCWKDRMAFGTTFNQGWYDLTQVPGTLIPYTVKDSDLVSLMLYHLLEPQLNAGTYAGSDMFVLDDFTQALQRRRNQFLLETGMVTNLQVYNATSPTPTRYCLPDSVIDIRRVSWIDAGNIWHTLWRSDEWLASALSRGWENSPAVPEIYSIAAIPPLDLRLIPPPADVGKIQLVAVSTGAALNPSSGVLLGIPDDFAWVVKWGALADLLNKDGQARDEQRAAYCDARWKEGVELARRFSSVVTAYVDGVAIFANDLRSLDFFRQDWENESGIPDIVASASWNLVALSAIPEITTHGIMLEVVKNAPIPSQGTDQIQASREELDVILDYAEHLAAFKDGVEEIKNSVPLYQNMVRLATVRNERLRAGIPFYIPLLDTSPRDEKQYPRRVQEVTT